MGQYIVCMCETEIPGCDTNAGASKQRLGQLFVNCGDRHS